MRRQAPYAPWRRIALGGVLLALALPATTAIATEARVAVAGALPIPSADTILSTPMNTTFNVTLRGRDPSALTAFITNLYDTSSPNYHHYLTPSQFAARFGASASAVSAVRDYLTSYGLHVGNLSRGHIVLHASGSTTDIARAFATPVATVRRSDGVLAAQFRSRATLPASIADHVAGVAGLSSVVAPSSRAVVSHAGGHATPVACPSAGSGSATTPNALGGYTALQQAQLYGLSGAWSAGFTGVGQTIAVYELGSANTFNLNTYFSCYGLSPSLSTLNVDGGPGGANIEEATLDVEEAAVLAPGAAIQIYQGPNSGSGPTDVYQQIADDNTATIVSTSWGTCESDPSGDPAAEQPIFQQMAAQGQTVVSASGDNGSSDCSGITNNNLAVDDPASQPYVTGVGGLSVTNLNPLVQTVWNSGQASGSAGASGGGMSALWSRPTWQLAPGITAANTKRMVPDLSTMGDPNSGFIEFFTGSGACHVNCSSGWSSIGGTSIGSPIVSALVAVAAQSCAVGRLGFINPSLYSMASTGYVDVTSGTNDLFVVGDYSAAPGYDMASGLGSPKPGAFIAGLCPPPFDLSKSSFVTSPLTASVDGTGATVSVTLHDANNKPLVNSAVSISAVGPSGRVLINGDHSSITGTGTAAYGVTTDSSGTASFDVASSTPGPVIVTVNYSGQLVYRTSIKFTSAVSSSRPGRAAIARLTAIVGGFVLSARAPASNGGSAITSYQYSLNGSLQWMTFASRSTTVRVTTLAKGRTYRVVVRALNAVGPGAASPAKTIVTRK